jgi:tetratricopeptide (TPR) repeat protein
MLPPRLLEFLLPQGGNRIDVSDDVLAEITWRSLAEHFWELLGEDGLSTLAAAIDHCQSAPSACSTANDEIWRGVYERFRQCSPEAQVSPGDFELRFNGFIARLKSSLEQAGTPRLIEAPCREFGELDLDELSRMQAPADLSNYMSGLAKHYGAMGVIRAADVDHLIGLIEKMVSAPGYLRFLSKDRKKREVVLLLGIARDIQSSCLRVGQVMDDMLISIGLLLFNISPSEQIASYLSSLRPSKSCDALLYHYSAILSLNSMLAGRLDLASMYAAATLTRADDRQRMAYVLVLQGCIRIRQGDYDSAVQILQNAFGLAPPGRMRGQVCFFIGAVHFEKKEYASAIKCFEVARGLFTDPVDQVTVHNNIGSCAMHMGDLARARGEFEEMERLSGRLGVSKKARCRLVTNSYLGTIWQDRGNHEKAIRHYKCALKAAIDSSDHTAVANQLGNIGTAYGQAGNHARAIQLLNACMAYSEQMGYWAGIRFAYWHICRLLDDQGLRSEAAEFAGVYTARYPELKGLR